MVLSVTLLRCHSRFYPSQLKLVLDLAITEGCKAELNQIFIQEFTYRSVKAGSRVSHDPPSNIVSSPVDAGGILRRQRGVNTPWKDSDKTEYTLQALNVRIVIADIHDVTATCEILGSNPISNSLVLVKRLAGNSVPEMNYLLSSGTLNL